jgi:UDP-N-acetylmuramyl pentapeptide synthase
MVALQIAKQLNLDINSLISPIKDIPYIEHRLQLMYNPVSDIYVIDDSYNGNIQ